MRTPFEVVHKGLECAFDPFQDYLFVEGVVIVPPMRGRSSYRRIIFAVKKLAVSHGISLGVLRPPMAWQGKPDLARLEAKENAICV